MAIFLFMVLKKSRMGGILMVSVPNVVKLEYRVICCNFLSHTEYTVKAGFVNRRTTASLQPVDAVRGKVDVKSRQSLGSVYQYSTQTLFADLTRD